MEDGFISSSRRMDPMGGRNDGLDRDGVMCGGVRVTYE